jgi:hypothetical protein
VDGSGNLFITDIGNQRVRRVDARTGIITTVAGIGTQGFSGDGGPATSAQLDNPSGLAVDNNDNLFIADTDNNRIRRVAADTGIITTVAGNGEFIFSGDGGPAMSAALNTPIGVTVDGRGNVLIADQNNNRIRQVAADTGIITTVAGEGTDGFSGDGGPATRASLNLPTAVAMDISGNIYIVDAANNRIRKITYSPPILKINPASRVITKEQTYRFSWESSNADPYVTLNLVEKDLGSIKSSRYSQKHYTSKNYPSKPNKNYLDFPLEYNTTYELTVTAYSNYYKIATRETYSFGP